MPDVFSLLLPALRLPSLALGALPVSVRHVLGGSRVQRDGRELHPEMGLILRLEGLTAPEDWARLGPRRGRALMRRGVLLGSVRVAPVAGVRDLTIDGAEGPLDGRLYVPRGAEATSALLVYYHGGCHVLGDLDTHDAVCRLLAAESGARVLAVDYRLAPEQPFPAATDDAVAAFRWAVANADELGADPARIAVGGDSAGGNLAAVTAIALRDAGDDVQPAFQLLIYPVVDFASTSRSREIFAKGFLLTDDMIAWGRSCYAGTTPYDDPRLSPLHTPDLSGLPPAHVITAGFDPLRDEGMAYADRLAEAGVPTGAVCHDGLIHGFINMYGVSEAARAATVEAAHALRAGLAVEPVAAA